MNETDIAWQFLSQHIESHTLYQVDIILDNAGFELLMDLCLADWFIVRGLTKKVILHGKAFGWFVSDVVEKDIHILFQYCFDWISISNISSNSKKNGYNNVNNILKRWKSYFDNQQWIFNAPSWMTWPISFWQITSEQWRTEIYNDSKITFLIFKGDLNYRKMLDDSSWPFTTSCMEAWNCIIKNLKLVYESNKEKQSELPSIGLLALRTCKSDLIVGLKEGQEDVLTENDPKWLINGEFGVIQFVSN